MTHVDVRWLAALHAEEEEPVAADPQQRWHSTSLSRGRLCAKGRAPHASVGSSPR
jgi:hypothetical protein